MGTCNQANCETPGAFRFTWPGNDEAEICWEHVPKLAAVASAMGLHLEIRPVENPIVVIVVPGAER